MASTAGHMHAGLLEITKTVRRKRKELPTAQSSSEDAQAAANQKSIDEMARSAIFQALYLASVPAFSGAALWIVENVIMFCQVCVKRMCC